MLVFGSTATASCRNRPISTSGSGFARQIVRVRNEYGELRAALALDELLREGVVAMSHGFGNERTSGMPTAQSMPGVNVNELSPTGAGTFDPLGGMSQLTGIRVEVEAATQANP